MAKLFEIVKNNKDEILDGLEEAIPRALEAIGMQAEAYAKLKCPVDTGLLRNSITHAVAGEPAATKSYHADKVKNGTQAVGFYQGNSPPAEHTVYVGSNVEYAPYVEYGHLLPGSTGTGGTIVPGEYFLQKAILGHQKKYKALAEAALKGFQ